MATASALPNEQQVITSKLPLEMARALAAPLPPEAIKPHPTKDYLSSVKAIYVIERLNEVFGLGGWTYRTAVVEAPPATDPKKGAMVVMHVVLRVPAYGIRLEQYGGSDNADRGDAFKGAVTDALSKIGSYLGIAMSVYKGGGPTKANPRGQVVTMGTQAAADQVAQQKIAAGRARQAKPQPAVQLAEQIVEYTYEDAPEDEQPTVEEQLQYSIDAERTKRLDAFAGLRSRYCSIGFLPTYEAILGRYSVRDASQFADTGDGVNESRCCYREMDTDLKKREARGRR